MIGLDTNVLARYYVDDAADKEATRQRLAARALIESARPLKVAKTVLLELEWVLRGYYGNTRVEIARVLQHCLSLPNLTVEDRAAVERALDAYSLGLDFADALHQASYAGCEFVASFDDKGFARKVTKHRLLPPVKVPATT
ncbi:MAG TPA: type II toxin-antitoxin system VapC family toxin [Casimicrobium huifangae]|nr:type II toxin-antitoxin system VapC family toxin [Casimicrobium huifangae]